MSIDKLKTKFITGAFINDVKHYFSKINEIIDWINNIGSNSVVNYKEYTVILNQSGTNAPIPIILTNTLGGTPIWTYDSTGYYICTLSDTFTVNKTWAPGVYASDASLEVQLNDINSFGILVTNDFGATGLNDALQNTGFQVRVYN